MSKRSVQQRAAQYALNQSPSYVGSNSIAKAWKAGRAAGVRDARKRFPELFRKLMADERWQVQLNHREHVEALRADLIAAHERIPPRDALGLIWPMFDRIKQR